MSESVGEEAVLHMQGHCVNVVGLVYAGCDGIVVFSPCILQIATLKKKACNLLVGRLRDAVIGYWQALIDSICSGKAAGFACDLWGQAAFAM